MKKFCYLLSLFLLTFMLTGCVKFNVNMDIKKDKSMDYTMIYAVDTSVFGDETSPIEDEDRKKLEEQGFTIEEYKDDKMKGYKLVKHINNIDEVSTESDAKYSLSALTEDSKKDEEKYIFKVKKGLIKNTYTANFEFDTDDSELSDSDTDLYSYNENSNNNSNSSTTGTQNSNGLGEFSGDLDLKFDEADESDSESGNFDYSKMSSNMDLSFNVTLPYSAKSNNATNATDNNKNLSWDLTKEQKENIKFEFELYNWKVIYGIAASAGVLIVLVVILLISRKKKGKLQETNPVTPSEQAPLPEVPQASPASTEIPEIPESNPAITNEQFPNVEPPQIDNTQTENSGVPTFDINQVSTETNDMPKPSEPVNPVTPPANNEGDVELPNINNNINNNNNNNI